jgi:phage terminase small subunit
MARPRKPTHLKIVTGTLRRDRTNPHEPAPVRARLSSPPGHLSELGCAAWTEAAKIAADLGVLTGADALALEGLAEALADLRAARSSLASPLKFDGKIVAEAAERFYWTLGKSGPMRRPRPELAAISDADRRVSVWLARFGFSPADRSKVTAASGEPANPFAALEA